MSLSNFFCKIKKYINKNKHKQDCMCKEINILRQSSNTAHNKINELEYQINELNTKMHYVMSFF